MCGIRIENEVEICSTNLANKTKCMSTNKNKWKKKKTSLRHPSHMGCFEKFKQDNLKNETHS
jgi:hypothetical protein